MIWLVRGALSGEFRWLIGDCIFAPEDLLIWFFEARSARILYTIVSVSKRQSSCMKSPTSGQFFASLLQIFSHFGYLLFVRLQRHLLFSKLGFEPCIFLGLDKQWRVGSECLEKFLFGDLLVMGDA